MCGHASLCTFIWPDGVHLPHLFMWCVKRCSLTRVRYPKRISSTGRTLSLQYANIDSSSEVQHQGAVAVLNHTTELFIMISCERFYGVSRHRHGICRQHSVMNCSHCFLLFVSPCPMFCAPLFHHLLIHHSTIVRRRSTNEPCAVLVCGDRHYRSIWCGTMGASIQRWGTLRLLKKNPSICFGIPRKYSILWLLNKVESGCRLSGNNST